MDLLLADDDEATRWVVKRSLRDILGLAIHEAANGEEAVASIDRRNVDVVLTDLRMGGPTDGVDVLCHALQRQPHARRVLMTGEMSLARLQEEARRACVDHAFEKPDRLEGWAHALEVALDGALPWGRGLRVPEPVRGDEH